MPTVHFSRAISHYTGGVEEIHIEAATVRELIRVLDRRFPGLGEQLTSGMAVAIDGEIVSDPLLERVEPESEIHFLPPSSGG